MAIKKSLSSVDNFFYNEYFVGEIQAFKMWNLGST
jgi:hypothetical protein